MGRAQEAERKLPPANRTEKETERGDHPTSSLLKVAFWFVAVDALAGAGSLILFPTHTARLFFWEITPSINAALFGALYLGGAVGVALVSLSGRWEPARFLVPILVSAGALISLTTLLHVDLFTPGPRLAYWLVYVGAPLLALLFYVQHERAGADWKVYRPVTPVTRNLAIAVGASLVVLGVLVLIGPAPIVVHWPWPITPWMVVSAGLALASALAAALLVGDRGRQTTGALRRAGAGVEVAVLQSTPREVSVAQEGQAKQPVTVDAA